MTRLRLRTDGVGYLLDDSPIDGFPDRLELPDRQRLTIAEWARRFTPDAVEEAQARLLKQRPEPRRSSPRQRELAANRRILAELDATGLWAGLSTEQRGWVVRPGTHPGLPDDIRYPLTMGQLRRLTGATERQLRWWIDSGLVPAVRDDAARRVYSGGAAWALLLAGLQQPEKTVLRRVQGGASPVFVQLLSATLRAWSARSLPMADQRRVEHACRELTDVARLMTGVPADDAGAEEDALDIEVRKADCKRLWTVMKPASGGVMWVEDQPESEYETPRSFWGSDSAEEPGTIRYELRFDPGVSPAQEINITEIDLTGWVVAMGAFRDSAHVIGDLSVSETIVHTVPHHRGWANKVEGNMRVSNIAPTKAEAERLGRELAMKRGAVHLVHGKDGRIQRKKLYSHVRGK